MSERQTLLFQISPQSSLLLGNRSGTSNFQETNTFIPGSALRGALAEKLLTDCCQANNLDSHDDCPDPATCPFWQLFGGEEPLFGNAYPGGSYGPIWPIPLTARTCKRYKGWPTGRKPGHGIFDVLLADFVYGLITDPAYPHREILQPALEQAIWSGQWRPEQRETADICPKCSGPVKPLDAMYYGRQGSPQPAKSFARQRAVHVGINRARGVAEEGLLFTQESLAVESTDNNFYAEVVVEAGKAAALKAAMSGTFYVGRGRSRGYGEVMVNAANPAESPNLARRLSDMNLGAATMLKHYKDQDDRVNHRLSGQLFSLTLNSQAILTDGGRPVRFPEPDFLGLPEGVVKLQSWARMEQVGGWHSAGRMPRRTEPAVKAGSVFLYYAPESINETDLRDALARLEVEGIGEERERGYGRLTVCAPFHTEQKRESK